MLSNWDCSCTVKRAIQHTVRNWDDLRTRGGKDSFFFLGTRVPLIIGRFYLWTDWSAIICYSVVLTGQK